MPEKPNWLKQKREPLFSTGFFKKRLFVVFGPFLGPPGAEIMPECGPRDQLSNPKVSSKSGQWRPDSWPKRVPEIVFREMSFLRSAFLLIRNVERRGDKEGGPDPLVFQACGRSCMRSAQDTSRGSDQDEVTLHANQFMLAWRFLVLEGRNALNHGKFRRCFKEPVCFPPGWLTSDRLIQASPAPKKTKTVKT